MASDSLELLLGEPAFIRQHTWETHTLEHPVSRPTVDVSNKTDCEEQIKLTVFYGSEKDATEETIFEGHVAILEVGGYVLVKGRSGKDAGRALLELFRKVNTWAREWKVRYGPMEAADGERS
jgi:hypothetical protein